MPRTPLADYVYLDEPAIDRFFSQVTPPIRFEKARGFRVALGLSGPSAEASQSMHSRPLTTHEKVSALRDYLARRTPSDGRGAEPLVAVSLTATQLFLPERQASGFTVSPLTLWLGTTTSEMSEGVAFLILLEDKRPQQDRGFMPSASAYSALMLLTEELALTAVPTLPTTQEASADSHRYSALKGLQAAFGEREQEFAADPVAFLAEAGAHVGATRPVWCLYRERTYISKRWNKLGMFPLVKDPYEAVIVGYPLAIAAVARA